MIQVNLIPDLKAEFLKAQRTRNTVVSIAFLVTGAFVTLTILMFLQVNVNQKRHSNNLTKHITELSEEYNAIEDLDKVITVQKQLGALPDLHNTKPLVSRLPGYLTRITPEQVEISDISVSFEDNLISIDGIADDVPSVNVFADTIKNAVFTIGDDKDNQLKAFSNVILDTIASDDDGATFEIKFSFDSALFTDHKNINLIVPEIESTLSERESPKVGDDRRENTLFDTQPQQGDE